MIIPNIWKVMKVMFQTTNQIRTLLLLWYRCRGIPHGHITASRRHGGDVSRTLFLWMKAAPFSSYLADFIKNGFGNGDFSWGYTTIL
jgi:hypothetical protein